MLMSLSLSATSSSNIGEINEENPLISKSNGNDFIAMMKVKGKSEPVTGEYMDSYEEEDMECS